MLVFQSFLRSSFHFLIIQIKIIDLYMLLLKASFILKIFLYFAILITNTFSSILIIFIFLNNRSLNSIINNYTCILIIEIFHALIFLMKVSELRFRCTPFMLVFFILFFFSFLAKPLLVYQIPSYCDV